MGGGWSLRGIPPKVHVSFEVPEIKIEHPPVRGVTCSS
jgi:hypothetical protein